MFITRWALSLLFTIFSLNSAFAETFRWVSENKNGGTQYLVGYAEEGLFRADLYESFPGELQTRIWQKTFSNENEWLQFLDVYSQSKNFIRQELESLDVPTRPLTETLSEKIWQATESWNEAWEDRYADWINNDVTPSFFVDNNLRTDCADVAYSLRWIFARMHHLPAANRLAGSGVLFTNESMRQSWINLPTAPRWQDDQRFLAALDYLLENTYTHTLRDDSYPVAVDRNFKAGGIHLEIYRYTGHTFFLHRVDLTGESADPIRTMYSTVPREVRPMMEDTYWIFEQPQRGQGGLLRMRWPKISLADGRWSLAAPADMPNYSEEQYSGSFMGRHSTFSDAVLAKLNVPRDPYYQLISQVRDLKHRILQRIFIVLDGFTVCSTEVCDPGTSNWEAWSTPARDQKIYDKIRYIEDLIKQHPRDRRFKNYWRIEQENSLYWINDIQVTLKAIVNVFKNKRYSSDPRDDIPKRWGGLGAS